MKRKQKLMLAEIILSAVITALIYIFFSYTEGIIKILLFVLPYLIVGRRVLWNAVRNIVHGQIFDENFLMCIATVGAFCLGEYVEAVGVMIFYQTGELFSSIAVGKSRKSISELMKLRPDSAVRISEGVEERLSPEDVCVGDIIIVRPGEKIPLDGVIVEGECNVDTSALTGESMPRSVCAGERVMSGSVSLDGVIRIRVDSEYSDSTVSRILELVENAASKKSVSERFITRFAKYYTPCVVIGALLLALIPSLFLGNPAVWIKRALIFLMVSCPCALVISVPLSFFGGIGAASKRGILVKGATYLEELSKIDTAVFDKTGTLSTGSFEVSGAEPRGIDEEELLFIAAHLELYSNHPIAEPIRRSCLRVPDADRVSGITEYAGMGVGADIDGVRYYAGNARLMKKMGVTEDIAESSVTSVYLSRGTEYIGRITLEDGIKEDSVRTLEYLKENSVRTVMLSGDTREIAERVGARIGIDEVRSELLPADKVDKLEELIKEGRRVAFVGDGINDAPALSRANVGIAMGGVGSDAAIEAADVVFLNDKPSRLIDAVKISKKTVGIVRQNIIFSLCVKGIILLLGALGYAGIWTAIFGDVGVMVIAILNAMRTMSLGKGK